MPSQIHWSELASTHLPQAVPYAVVAPDAEGPLPVCILLIGAGGSRESLRDLQPVLDAWWAGGSIPPMLVATPSAGLDYYLEEPEGPLRWDSFLALDFLPALRSGFPTNGTALLAGISGGGYGALKLAFANPELFSAVAAMQPMLEPGLDESAVGMRNRLHHSAGGPPALIGTSRNDAVWKANNPANRVQANAERIRTAGLAIYLECGDDDFLNAHDGTEFLHRILWDQDISHEYRLVRNADHGGPGLRPRLRSMFSWFGSLSNPPRADEATEKAAELWIWSGMQGPPPPGATTTQAFIDDLRTRFEPLRAEATKADPSTARRYGRW